MSDQWFTVDKSGLAAILARRGAWFVVYELIQNAIDEPGVTTVNINLDPEPGRPAARLTVTDDAPDGFADLTHAYRLFAPSNKKGNAEQRGRFNLGEKLVLALCESADIVSTTGGYHFNANGTRTRTNRRTETGSTFEGVLRMTRADVAEAGRRVFEILPPPGVTITYNGQTILTRQPVRTFKVSLPTEIADDDGYLRPTRRTTTVGVYEPVGDETPSIYEMGIPVVESDDRYHLDVGQKVPLNMDRDNVTPAYLRTLRTAALNEMHATLNDDDATATWVKEAVADPNVDDDAVRSIVTKLYGADAVVYDPSDPEANKRAAAEGRTVIPPRAFDKAGWANVRRAAVVQPAGQVTPSNSALITSYDGIPPIAEDEWTDSMRRVVEYAQRVAKVVLGHDVDVDIDRAVTGQRWAAAYGDRHLRLNLGQLGHRWFNEPDVAKIDALLIHEYGHEYSPDHLSAAYHDALCRIGATMKAHAQELTFS